MDAASNSTVPKRFVTHRLSRLQSRLNAQAIKLLRANSDLSLTEWRIMAMSAGQTDVTLSFLARETDLDKGQLSRAVATLINKKLMLSSVNKDDHRQHLLQLSDAGNACHSGILPIMEKRQSALVSGLNDGDLNTLHAIIDRLEQVLETDV